MEDSKEPLTLLPLPEARSAQIIRQALPTKEQASSGGGGDGGDIDVPCATTGDSQRQNFWYALFFPKLVKLSEVQQANTLQELVSLMESIISTVSFHHQALIYEVRSSLKYFSGI